MISSFQKVVSATRVAREIEQKHDDTPSTASREIVHLAIQPNLSVDVNFRKLQWIDGGDAGGAVTIQFVEARENANRADSILYSFAFNH